MEAIREIMLLKDNKLTIELPASFAMSRVEIVVFRIESSDTNNTAPVSLKRRSPSPLLAGTRIIGDIMSPVIADKEWDALS